MDQPIEQDESTALIEQAKAIVAIADVPGYHVVYNQRGLLKDMIKLRKEKAKPHIDNAQKALDDLTDELAKYVDPMALEYKRLGGLMVDYDNLQEQLKRQREREQAIADQKATAAAEAEKAQLAALATELNAPELAEEIEQTPVEPPIPQVIVKDVPKTGASFSTYKKYEVVDLKALVKAVAKEIDQPQPRVPILALKYDPGFLHKQATALFDACPEIPGKFGPKREQKRLLYPGVEIWGEKGARQ